MDEEQLIEAVLRVRGDQEQTAAQVFALLQAEQPQLTLPQVKKACSKAAKRQPKVAEPAPPSAAAVSGAKAAKQAKQAVDAMKAAETGMMAAQRRLRLAKCKEDVSKADVACMDEARFSAVASRWIARGRVAAPPLQGESP